MAPLFNSDAPKASNTSVTPLINIDDAAPFELSYNTFLTQLAKTKTAIECKVLLQDYQEQMDEAFKAGVDPGLLIQARSKLIDMLLRYLWTQEDWGEQKIALIAVGGYGRGELHPRSDIDLLFVLEKAASKKNGETIGRMVTY